MRTKVQRQNEFSGDPSFEGGWWLHELKYGAEKSLEIARMQRWLGGRMPKHIDRQMLSDSLKAAQAKRAAAAIELRKLVGSEVVATPLRDGEPVAELAITGMLQNFNFADRTLRVRQEGQVEEITYASLENIPLCDTPAVVSQIALEACVEYKF